MVYNLHIFALSIIEMLDGLRIFMGWGHGRIKNSYKKIKYPSITFDGNEMEGWCKIVKDSPRGDLSCELYPLS